MAHDDDDDDDDDNEHITQALADILQAIAAIEVRLVALEEAPGGVPQAALENVSDLKAYRDIQESGSSQVGLPVQLSVLELGRKIELFAAGDNRPIITPAILVGFIDNMFTPLYNPPFPGTDHEKLFGFYDVLRQLITGIADTPATEPFLVELADIAESTLLTFFRAGLQIIPHATVKARLPVLRQEITDLI